MRDWIPSYTEEELREAFKEAGKEDDLSGVSLDREQGRELIAHYLFHRIHVAKVIEKEHERMFNYATSDDLVTNLNKVASLASSDFEIWRGCDRWTSIEEFVRYVLRQPVTEHLDDPAVVVSNLGVYLRAGTPLTMYTASDERVREVKDRAGQALKNPVISKAARAALQAAVNASWKNEGQLITDEEAIRTVAENVAGVFIDYREQVQAYAKLGRAFIVIRDAMHTIKEATQHATPPELTQPLSQTMAGKAAQDAVKVYREMNQ